MIARYRNFLVPVVLALVLGAAGCSSAKKEESLLDELANLDKETIFNRAEGLYSKGDYKEARELFSFVYDSFPNDPLGHKAALRVADTYAVKKDVTSLTEARLRYRDFVNRYPNDPDRDYALLMVGNTYSSRQLRPDRDLSDLHQALAAYQQLVNLYPDSQYYGEAETRIHDLQELLAQHEWLVAAFYIRNKRYLGALWRLEYIQENYPNYSQIELVNDKISELNTTIAERQEAWEKHIEELEKASED